MNSSKSWIKAYVPDLNCTDQEFFDAMTLSGTKTETYEPLDKNLDKIVVGQIDKIEPHPDADKLVICQVNIGTETIQIVTGANNMKEGDKVPVVLDGGRVAGGHDGGPLPEGGIKIKAGKLRGVPSAGMMCSIEELGSTRDFYPEAPEEGLYIFPQDTEVGADAVEVLGLHDTVFEFEVTSNRVDCYSILGIARETAATYKLPFKAPVVEVKEEADGNAKDMISVEIKDTDLCTNYCARVVKDIKIAPSPEWMQRRLASVGIRPINNLVDITNYVMMEYGQPMHAYDMSTIAGNKIVVKRAADGDTFVTLDGQERKLDKDVLMICDGEKEVGIAGIMGGENSMITDNVDTVLFEAATFNGPNIRKSAKRVGLRTDASGLFEKGLDPANALDAINRACQLVVELGCGKVVPGVVQVGLPIAPLKRIPLEADRINKLLGTDISKDEMVEILKREEVEYDAKTDEVIIPSFRQDLNQMCDIAEEVARFSGYDKIPTTLPKNSATTGGISFKMRVEKKAREVAQFCGFSQGYTYSFESPKVFDKLLLPEDAKERQAIRISNPLGEDFSIMRTISLNGILTSLATNYNRRNKDVRLYEMGNIYVPKSLPLTELPDERMQLTLGFYGEGDFYSMKGAVEEFLDSVHMLDKLTYDPNAGKPFLHPGRQANIVYDGEVIGYLGEVHPAVCDNYDIDTRVYVAVIDMPHVVEHAKFDTIYTGIAKFPAVTRDLSMVVPKNVLAGDIEKMIRQRGGKKLESLELFDIYEGAQIKEGFKSMAYSLSFRDKEKTLEDEEVAAAMKKILNGLESLNIELRS
ncbi:phenylalanine--tRNA ligase subunit beta [Butyrivibrio hungatei]|uniref:Phenylalanine--tRNA ligase beta subunit n=1 Tax=Butyrivibrio hungatei TaxID=185008 RepID=A0A1D9P2D9_9FIRM|nr:phenylalanine--tRNA ligase subunit beta [Butyrivibrio hungatei]AOZ96663.1 phenylalanyl-tRNA synthetase beta subunit PheT [Butyrivibrio hungatei]